MTRRLRLLPRRRPPAPVPPERLARAVAECGYRDVECGSDEVVLRYDSRDGWVPTIRHWPLDDGTWCPVMANRQALERASLDLLAALARVSGTGIGDYCEPVGHLLVAA